MYELVAIMDDGVVVSHDVFAIKVGGCMNKQTEALKMAIEALQNNQVYDCEGKPMLAIEEANEKAIQACKEALEQPAQEPVAWMRRKYDTGTNPVAVEWDYSDIQIFKHDIPLYTHPAPSWQGLSDDDMEKAKFYDESFYNGARWAEQALKEKNHG